MGEAPQVPEPELTWKFARSGGPGGQNVNKVASKAVLIWNYHASPSISDRIKERLARLFPRYMIQDGWLQIASQEHRDQDRNRQVCLEKLAQVLSAAAHEPKPRRATRPTRGSKLRRLAGKKHRSGVKAQRRQPGDDGP